MKNKTYTIYLIYIWLFLFALAPLLLIFIASLLSRDTEQLVNLPFTFRNYQELFTPAFGIIFARSFSIAFITTLICLVFAYPFSYLIIRSKYRTMLLTLIIIPFWTSSLVRTYSLIAILKLKGIFNIILFKLHLIEQPLSLMYTNFAVVTGLVYNLFPFMVLPIFTNMERFDFRLIEAGKDLGAKKWTLFSKVFLPNTLPGIVSGTLLVFLPAMTLFYIPNVLGGARSVLLGNLIQNQFLVLENWPQGSATSVLLTFLLILLLFFFRRYAKEIIH
jgi:spermidine/putrescine transport system permease protein